MRIPAKTCTKCNKKGVRSRQGNYGIYDECRYCKASIQTHKRKRICTKCFGEVKDWQKDEIGVTYSLCCDSRVEHNHMEPVKQ